ncbi:MAG: hypothetical protein WCP59_17870 [Actinomycetota bacterium]
MAGFAPRLREAVSGKAADGRVLFAGGPIAAGADMPFGVPRANGVRPGGMADTLMVLVDRLGPARDRLVSDIEDGAAAIDAQAVADLAEIEALNSEPAPIPTAEQLAARAYWAPLARTEFEGLDAPTAARQVADQMPDLLADPNRAAATADVLRVLRGVADRNINASRVPSPVTMFASAQLAQQIEALHAAAWPADRRAAFEMRPTLLNVRNLSRFVNRSARARVNDLIGRGSSGAIAADIGDRFARLWVLDSVAIPNMSSYFGEKFQDGDVLAQFLARQLGLTGLGLWS